jgi:glyoxylase-like metal-dependent hydrolase (beta-lactamase superfamily II)
MTVARYSFGEVEVLALTDAREVTSRQALFPSVPAALWLPYVARYPSRFEALDSLNWDYTCYILRTEGRTMLIDAGIGPADGPVGRQSGLSGQLLKELATVGIRTEDVDTVILTHLHPDHVGWTVMTEAARPRITFPRALYIAHRADWDTFWRPETQAPFAPGYVDWCLSPLRDEGRISLVEDAEVIVAPSIRLQHAPGHTPGSVVVRIGQGDGQALLVGDVIAHPAQLNELSWEYVWDMDPDGARDTRLRILRDLPVGYGLGAAHFGFGRIEEGADGTPIWRD